MSVPLGMIIRDYLGYADNLKEAKRILSNREVLVDNKVRVDHKYPVGFMDIISIPKIGKIFALTMGEDGKLKLEDRNSHKKLVRLENKHILKGGKIQYNFHDSGNFLVEEDKCKTGDVLEIDVEKKKIEKVIPMDPDNSALLIGGRWIGNIAKIKDNDKSRNMVYLELDGREISTTRKNVFVVGGKGYGW